MEKVLKYFTRERGGAGGRWQGEKTQLSKLKNQHKHTRWRLMGLLKGKKMNWDKCPAHASELTFPLRACALRTPRGSLSKWQSGPRTSGGCSGQGGDSPKNSRTAFQS